ncbi:AlbA family DNA-binding domain-containing protein [Maribacter cobaltidurans]|uniref:Schlafen AlbA-2 domain-containing protein n=1 Tax=Maribacter cobaltidurans TaxID=1178778 RepID=A0A223V3L8_9FLAO|nr:ATP-binding protein [Maribacter cobaltidurans]ASV29588.1 hypothetical protein CJ263_04815 [Maribacter cobaltidurans]|tara:strand:- start:1061 stop:1861 length:801 start_codon:yes stop_codon:yes gene_type:complete
MIIKKTKIVKVLSSHILFGLLVFYFILHPLTMAIYGFECAQEKYTFNELLSMMGVILSKTFSFEMLPMSYIFIVVGIIFGLISGLYWFNILHKKVINQRQHRILNADALILIKNGENNYVEFKSSIRYDFLKKTTNRDLELVIAKTIVGFMNAQGGKLIIGVEDNMDIIGLQKDMNTLKHKNPDGYERKVYEIIATYIGAEFSSLCQVDFHKINDEFICIIRINNSKEPVYMSVSNKTTFYLRTGNSTNPLTVRETVKYLKIRKHE